MAEKNITQEQLNSVLTKIDYLEKIYYELRLKNKDDLHELEKMITNAVRSGNEPILLEIESMKKRIVILETSEANKALEKSREAWKTVRTVLISGIVTFFVTLLLNNAVSLINDNKMQERKENENVQIDK